MEFQKRAEQDWRAVTAISIEYNRPTPQYYIKTIGNSRLLTCFTFCTK